MARIALVQSYPYEAVTGGDAAYIGALRNYLISSGHDVFGMVSDTVRGRALPYYFSAYDLKNVKSWKVRQSVRLGNLFISYNVRHLYNLFLRLLLNKSIEEDKTTWDVREAYWVRRQLLGGSFDCVILLFGATKFTDTVVGKWKTVSVLGFLDDVFEVANGKMSNTDIDTYKINDGFSYLADAPCIALNNISDMRYLKNKGFNNIIQINMGYEYKKHRANTFDKKDPVVILVGAHTSPNIASCTWFLNHIWPIIMAARPDARLRLVGRIASLLDTQPRDGVEGVGYVPELQAEYDGAQVVVAPLVVGSRGVKIKVAEALSYGCALVTTSLGIDAGSDDQFSGAVDVADTAEEFAAAVLALLNDAELRRERQIRSVQAFEDNFSYHAAYGELARYLEI